MHGNGTRIVGFIQILIGGIFYGASGFSETYFGVRHLFFESPLYPLSMMFIIIGGLMVVGGSLFALVEKRRIADRTLRSKIQTGALINGYWKRDQKTNLRTLGTVFALSRNPLRLKIYEAMGQGTVDGVFHENEFLPRNPSQKDTIKPGASENAG